MKYADKLGAQFCIVLGDSEIESGVVKVKDMRHGGETPCDLNDIAGLVVFIKILEFGNRNDN